MNGFKMNLKSEMKENDHHTFLAPLNVVLPDSVGKIYFSLNIFVI